MERLGVVPVEVMFLPQAGRKKIGEKKAFGMEMHIHYDTN